MTDDEFAVGGFEARREVNQPQIGLVTRSLQRGVDAARKVTARIEQQDQRAAQIVGANVGQTHVITHLTRGTVTPGIAEVQTDLVAHVQHSGEDADVGLRQLGLRGAANVAGNLQLPLACGQAGDIEHGRAGGGVPANRVRIDGLAGVGCQRGEDEVGWVQHAGQVAGICAVGAQPHGLVEGDGDLADRQRQYRAIGHAHRADMRRLERCNFIDPVALGHQDATVGGGEDGLTTGTTRGELQDPAGCQFNHPHRGLMRRWRCRIHRDGALLEVAGRQQQTGQRRAGGTKADAVDYGVEAEFQLGPALGAPGHRKADDVGGASQLGSSDVFATPLHGPQAAVGAKAQVADPLVAEMLPGEHAVALVRLEHFNAVAG